MQNNSFRYKNPGTQPAHLIYYLAIMLSVVVYTLMACFPKTVSGLKSRHSISQTANETRPTKQAGLFN
jgi:hypothetical protein